MEVVVGDVVAHLWRPPTDNDGVSQGWMSQVSGVRRQWVGWGLDSLEVVVDKSMMDVVDGVGVIRLQRRLLGTDAHALHTTNIEVCGGIIRFREVVEIPEEWNDLPRVGVRFEVPADFDRIDWFGRGPEETYSDRCGAATVGRWGSRVSDQYHPFVFPQEHGNHVDTRWFDLTRPNGSGFRIGSDRLFNFSARDHHDVDITAATTIAELEPRSTVEVHVDSAVRGLGTAACGPDALAAHRVCGGTHSWEWTIRSTQQTR